MPRPCEPLQGLTAIVTGAARGVGAATARLLHEAGASILLVDSDVPALERVSAELGMNRAALYPADIADDGVSERIVDAALDGFGRVDVLVNNAGVQGPPGTVTTASREDWRRFLAVNVQAPAELAAAAIRSMERSGGGSIVNIGSISSFLVFGEQAAYAASKGAIAQLTRSIALDFGPNGIRCNCVCPGPVFSGPLLEGRTRDATERDPAVAALVRSHPLRRLAEPEDVAEVVLFLAGPESRHVTGATIVVDGGFSLS